MLFFVVHRLGGSRKSAREVAASRLFCFTAGFSGAPNGIRFQTGRRRSLPPHNPTIIEQPSTCKRLVPVIPHPGLSLLLTAGCHTSDAHCCSTGQIRIRYGACFSVLSEIVLISQIGRRP